MDGVLLIPAALAAAPIRAGVDVTAARLLLASGGTAAALALLDTTDAGVLVDGGGRVDPGGLMNARGALGGLKADGPDGEGGMRPPCTRVGPSEGDRSGAEAEDALVAPQGAVADVGVKLVPAD